MIPPTRKWLITALILVCVLLLGPRAATRLVPLPSGAVRIPDAARFLASDSPKRLVTVTIASDYQCPYCRRLSYDLSNILPAFHGSVHVRHLAFPLTNHPAAFATAVAAECARQQGQFASMDSALFANQEVLSSLDLGFLARKAGIRDSRSFDRCRHGAGASVRVRAESTLASLLPLRGTPFVLVNDLGFDHAPDRVTLRQAIRRAQLEAWARWAP